MDQASDNFFHLHKSNYLCPSVAQVLKLSLISFSGFYEAQPEHNRGDDNS